MTTFLLIRHATTDLVHTTLVGWTPGVCLDREGRAQAARLAERLAQLGIAALYTSPLERARETAHALASRLELDARTCEDAGEVAFGDWTGRTFASLSGEARWQRFNTLRSLTRPSGGELMLEVQARMVALLDRLGHAHPDQVVAMVTHGDVIRSTIAHYAGIPIDLMHRLDISPASISALAVGEPGPRILGVNDTSHCAAA